MYQNSTCRLGCEGPPGCWPRAPQKAIAGDDEEQILYAMYYQGIQMSDDDKAHEKKTYRPMTYTKVLTTVLGCRYAYHNNERELI